MRENYRGLVIKTANPTGGKAGKNNNKTSTIQVLDPVEHRILKHFRYDVSNPRSFVLAYRKAKDYADKAPSQTAKP